jgi:DNA-binding transcriptional LysR family regulator
MNLEYLKTFLTIIKSHSFSAAAIELNLTQGAVSHHIATLEKYFDAELFNRTSNGVELTTAGTILAETAKKILAQVDNAKITIASTKEKLTGMVKINVSSIPGEHIIPSLIAEFQKTNPNIKFKIKAEDSLNSLINLQAGEADFAAVGTIKGYGNKLDVIEIGEEELVLIVPNKHELANRKSVALAEVTKYPYINREDTSGTRIEIEGMLEEKGISISELKTTLELGSTEAVITAVSECRGIGIISSIASKKAQAAGLVKVVRIEGASSKRKLYMVKPKRQLQKISEVFWNFCEEYTFKNTRDACLKE